MRGIFESIVAGMPRFEAKATDISALTWEKMFGGPSSKAGVSVNVDTSLCVSTALACLRVVAEGVAQLPLEVGTLDPDKQAFRPEPKLPVYQLLHQAPNDWMTSFELRETLMYNAALNGPGYALKNVLRGEVRELLPIPSGFVNAVRSPEWGVVYHVADPWGAIGTFQAKDLVIVRGPSWDGVLPLNIMRLAREAIGLSIATEEAHERMHANGARPGGLLSIDNGLSEEARERIKDSASQFSHQNAYKTMVLDKGATWTAMGMSGVDAQHLETRRFQIEEVCRFFRVFPHMVGYSDKTTTFASAESFFQGHVLHTLMPWLMRWQQVLKRDVLGRDLVARFNVRELIRGDTIARGQFYASGIVNGWLTRNDARRFEDLGPLDGLDTPLQPLNMGATGAAMAHADPHAVKAISAIVAAEAKSWAALGPDGFDPTLITALSARLADRICAVL